MSSELTEHILLQLNCPLEIIRAQRVCRNWRDLIQKSPILHDACWYRGKGPDKPLSASQQIYKLNPVFNQIGVQLWLPSGKIQEVAGFTLEKRIYDKPGLWATMLTTQPPCQRIEVDCYGDYSADDTMSYLIESMTGYLLMGDVMAVLAECQNRQTCGVDRFAGVEQFKGRFVPVTEEEWNNVENQSYPNWHYIVKDMANNVSVRVAADLPWGSGMFPAFSLRRISPHAEPNENPAGHTCLQYESSSSFLHELIVHRMIHHPIEYTRGYSRSSIELEKYEPNLVVVKEHPEGYLAEYSHALPLLFDVKKRVKLELERLKESSYFLSSLILMTLNGEMFCPFLDGKSSDKESTPYTPSFQVIPSNLFYQNQLSGCSPPSTIHPSFPSAPRK